MTETIHSQPKALLPRKLEERETPQTLNHWKSVFVNYYRRCQFYGFFLQPGVIWSNEVNHGFTTPEVNGLKRPVETLSFDLEGFLACLSSYLPFDYVSAKLISQTTCMAEVWQIALHIILTMHPWRKNLRRHTATFLIDSSDLFSSTSQLLSFLPKV